MKYLSILILALANMVSAAGHSSPEDLAAALREAISAKDVEKVLALHYTVGMTETDITRTKERVPSQLFELSTVSLFISPLGDSEAEKQISRIRGDMRISLTAQPTGKLEYEQKSADGKLTMKGGLPFGIVDGKYYILGVKIEKIQK